MTIPVRNTLKLARLHGRPEIFYSIQGEGVSMGVPSVFVRTSLCNLHCIWCDTDYTWNWIGTPFHHIHDADPGYRKFDKKEWIAVCSIQEVADLVRVHPTRNVVLTGGEPMLQQSALLGLMQVLRQHDPAYRFEIETNGAVAPRADFDAAIDQYNVSPKLENSGNSRRLREKPAVYRFFAVNSKASFKFVVSGQADVEEVLALVERYALPRHKVLLMPQADNRPGLEEKRQWLVEVCKTEGLRYTDRLHVQIWGSKRGV